MKRGLKKALTPSGVTQFVLLGLFAALTTYFHLLAGLIEIAVVILAIALYRRTVAGRRRDIAKYVDWLAQESNAAAHGTLESIPLPALLLRAVSGEVIWANESFYDISGGREHTFEFTMDKLIPGLDLRFLSEGNGTSEISLKNRRYSVHGSLIKDGTQNSKEYLATLYFVDITELVWLRREHQLRRPVVMIILLDNYEECMKGIADSDMSHIQAELDKRVHSWIKPLGGIARKYDRDKQLVIFEERHLPSLIETRFDILESIREIKSPNEVLVTVSIGVGKEGETLLESSAFAQLSIDMALSRGGDQAVLKNRYSFEFFGGRSKEPEKRTKVKSRIVASTLSRLIGDSDLILVMGHANSDIDAIGAAAGICCMARKFNTPAFIVADENHTAATNLIARLRTQKEYADCFIDDQTALIKATNNTLLVMVDCSRPDIAEAPELLRSIPRIAVIDHHRRAANYVDNAVLNFHEAYASSASELVCELLQNVCQNADILRTEAEALLGGIVLDTKNFTMHTGMRTFEAAAYLRGLGADTVEIKKLFQSNFALSVMRYDIITHARMLRGNIAVAAVDKQVDRTVAAQAADELLNIEGVQASFVLFATASQAIISARSLGKINVQLICEKLGGGGHQTIAGAQLPETSVADALTRLVTTINEYMDN